MHERIKYQKFPWYPNLREEENVIWNRFIDKYPDAYDEVIYNMHVGEGAEIPEGTERILAEDFRLLTQYKIDVIGFKNDRIDIIEVKPYAGASAIGQVLSYRELYKEHDTRAAASRMVVITNQERPDTKLLSKSLGVEFIIV